MESHFEKALMQAQLSCAGMLEQTFSSSCCKQSGQCGMRACVLTLGRAPCTYKRSASNMLTTQSTCCCHFGHDVQNSRSPRRHTYRIASPMDSRLGT